MRASVNFFQNIFSISDRKYFFVLNQIVDIISDLNNTDHAK